MHVLVTGAAGFIGSHLVEALLARGDSVLAVDNFDPFYAPDEKRANLSAAGRNSRFRLLELDVADDRALDRAIGPRPVDLIVHLAAKAGVRPSLADPLAYARVNIMGTQAVLATAQRLGVKRIVFASSSSVYGDAARIPFVESDPAAEPISPYAATKRAGELLCRCHQHLHGGSVICLRFFTVYGPRQRPDLAIRKFCHLISTGRPVPIFGDGSSERDYTWIDDILAGVLAAIDRGATTPDEFQVINLGESRTTSTRRLVELLSAALGIQPTIEYLPPQPGDVLRTCADVTKARQLLGYLPRTAVEDGIPRFVEWFRRLYRHDHSYVVSS